MNRSNKPSFKFLFAAAPETRLCSQAASLSLIPNTTQLPLVTACITNSVPVTTWRTRCQAVGRSVTVTVPGVFVTLSL